MNAALSLDPKQLQPHSTMLRFLSLTVPVLFVTAASLQAQTITFTGEIEDVSGTQNQFFADCTDTTLTSSTLNLNLFMDQPLEITGNWNGDLLNPAVDVTSVTPVVETFEIGGGAKIGETSNLSFFAAPGTVAAGRVCTQPGFLPLGDSGVLFVDLSTAVIALNGTVGGSGFLQVNFAIPNNPALVGLDIYGQGALIDSAGITLTNPDCKTIDN